MYFLDLDIGSGVSFRVGYLDSSEPYNKGPVPSSVVPKINELFRQWEISTRGFHLCPFCSNATGSSETYIFSSDKKVYRIPSLICHYIEEHEYQPPSEFLAAVDFCPIGPAYKKMLDEFLKKPI
jgi:hypothetical protein